MARWLELHDSDLLSVTATSSGTRVFLNGYVHQWESGPAGWTGTGWTQRVVIRVDHATTHAAGTATQISSGSIQSRSDTHENLIPLPARFPGPARLTLALADGTALEVSGGNVSVETEGEPTFVENLPEDLRPDAAG